MRKAVIALFVLVVGMGGGGVTATAHPGHDGPGYRHRALYVRGWPCEEDAVIVGVGEYEDGQFEAFECVNFEEAEKAWRQNAKQPA